MNSIDLKRRSLVNNRKMNKLYDNRQTPEIRAIMAYIYLTNDEQSIIVEDFT